MVAQPEETDPEITGITMTERPQVWLASFPCNAHWQTRRWRDSRKGATLHSIASNDVLPPGNATQGYNRLHDTNVTMLQARNFT